MSMNKIAPHETLGIHELISQQVIGIKKLTASIGMVNDADLKNFMQESLNAKKAALKEIEGTLTSQIGVP